MDRPNNNKKHDDFVERVTNKDLKPKKKPSEKQMFIAPSPKSKPKSSKNKKYGY